VQGRGKPIARDSDENNPYIDRGEYFMNRIVKRQGAKPPWIELLGGKSLVSRKYVLRSSYATELETAHTAFRSSLLSSYVRTIVRSLITSPFQSRQSLAQLTTEQVEALRDSKWQTREMAYHAEAVKDLNNTVRKMVSLHVAHWNVSRY
jgi:DnaJ family protein C protein 28